MKASNNLTIVFAAFLTIMFAQINAVWGQEHNTILKITSADMVSKAWDSQFFIVLDKEHPILSGDEGELSMDVRAIKETTLSTQMYKAPQEFLYSNGMNNISFTTEWVHITTSSVFSEKQEGGYTICFNLNEFKDANCYFFDNISFKINGEELIQNGDFEGDIFSNFFYVYDRGDVKQVTSDMIIEESDKPISIEVTTLPDVNYFVGDNLRLSNGVLSLISRDYAPQQIPLTAAEVTGYNPNLVGEQTLTVSYLDLITSFNVIVQEKDPNAINHVLRISSNGLGEQKELRIKLSQALPVGTEYSFSMNYYADKTVDRLSEYSVNGFCVFIGIADFTTQKKTYTKTDVVKNPDSKSIVFPLNCTVENNYYFDNISLIVNGKEMLYNGSFENTNLSNYYQNEANNVTSDMVIEEGGNPIAIEITSLPQTEYMVGKSLNLKNGILTLTYPNGSTKTKPLTDVKVTGYNAKKLGVQTLTVSYLNLKTTFDVVVKEKDFIIDHCLKITSADMVSKAWDSQFFIVLDKEHPIQSGDEGELSMDVRAIKGATISTQMHKAPQEYLYYNGMNEISFTTEWVHINTLNYFIDKQEGGYTISFNLNDLKEANSYLFDNISFKINGEEQIQNGDFEGDNFSNFFYVYDRGDVKQVTSDMIIDESSKPVSIAVTTLPETNYYVGDNLFLSKGILSLKFSDDATQQIPLTTAEVTGYNPNLIGEQTLTVSYLDLKTSFKVMVKEKDPNAINHVLRISSNGFGEQKELRIKLSQALPVGT